MLRFACFCLLLAAVTPVWSQVEPSASGGGFDLDDQHMMTPPPVSGDAYPVIVGSEQRANYLAAGLVFTGSYVDNLMVSNIPIADETYSFQPTISFDRHSSRQGESLHYSPGFELYQNTSQLNGISQTGSAGYRFHMSPYAVLTLGETFQQNYNLYNQGNPFVAGGISGSSGSPTTVLIAPFQNELTNSSDAGIEYQYGKNAMIGGSGTYSHVQYSNISTSLGLENSNTSDASAFYSRRLDRAQYAGLVYQFAKDVTHPIDTYTVTSSVLGFYTIYFTRSFSLSVLGGPERYSSWAPNISRKDAWTPAVQGSFGWQGLRSSISAGYSHVVSGAGGLSGSYKTTMVSVNSRVLLARTWSLGGNVGYTNFDTVNSIQAAQFGTGGRTISGGVGLSHRITEKINAQAGYQHFHQRYAGIPAASEFPDSNRAFVAISYQFSRPLGR
ncbi:MAG TPA: hypothetical protein VGF82_24705 [Terracidiphilus sp.]